jgi:DNA mismatch repair protein MSH5
VIVIVLISKWKVQTEVDECLENLLGAINFVVDFDKSKTEKRVIPKPGVDVELDELRQVYEGLGNFLTEFGKEEFFQYDSELVPALKCVYYPQIGFLVAVPVLSDHSIEEQLQLFQLGLEYQFHTETFVFYKSPRVIELDSHIGGKYC